MEKQEKGLRRNDSMTSVSVKDFGSSSGIDYQDPPPSYKSAGGKSIPLQIAKILATSGIIIAGMISFSIIISSWLASKQVCEQSGLNLQNQDNLGTSASVLLPQLLQSDHQTTVPNQDLHQSESKIQSNEKNKSDYEINEDSKEDYEDGGDDDSDESLTFVKLPLELNIHDYMLERNKVNQRAPINCIVEKKKSEDFVPKLNMTKIPRLLRLKAEKMSISCAPNQEDIPNLTPPLPFPSLIDEPHNSYGRSENNDPFHVLMQAIDAATQFSPILQPPPPPFPFYHHPTSSLSTTGTASEPASSSSNIPLTVIGPLPINNQMPYQFHPLQELLTDLTNGGGAETAQMFPFNFQQEPSRDILENPNNKQHGSPISIQDIGPILIPQKGSQDPLPMSQILKFHDTTSSSSNFQPVKVNIPPFSDLETSVPNDGPIMIQATSELRERALHQPIPIVPRPQFPHVIRPRSIDSEDKGKEKHRMKRCACDCACKNHN